MFVFIKKVFATDYFKHNLYKTVLKGMVNIVFVSISRISNVSYGMERHL